MEKYEDLKIEVIELSKTNYDPIAKTLRKYVKDEKINKKIICVCSNEEPIMTDKNTIASMSIVPSIAGVLATDYVIKSIINKKEQE